MKSGRLEKWAIGYALADLVLLIEAIIDIRTGKLTEIELLMLVVLSLLFAISFVAVVKKHKRKKTDP